MGMGMGMGIGIEGRELGYGESFSIGAGGVSLARLSYLSCQDFFFTLIYSCQEITVSSDLVSCVKANRMLRIDSAREAGRENGKEVTW